MKKKNLMKSLTALALSMLMVLSLAACGAKPSDGGKDEDKDGYTVAIIKQMDHASLDEIADAIAARLDAIAQEQNVSIRYTITSGQGDQSVLKQLADQAVADQVDAIIPIATTAAQVSAVAAEDSRTPVVYAAISDPDTAKLTGIDYVAEAKAYLEQHGITCVEQTANTNDEVVAAAAALISAKVDAVFTPTDNVIMAAELAIADDLAKAGIPHYTGADSFVRNGAFATCGVNYTELGARTATLAYQAMTQGMDGMEDYYRMDGGIITVNTDTAAVLKADYSVFSQMAQLVEVTTTKD